MAFSPRSILSRIRSVGGHTLSGLGGLSLPLDLDYLLSGPGTAMSRSMNSRNARTARMAEIPDTMEQVGGASETAGLDTALRYGRASMEGINSLRSIGQHTGMGLDALIQEDQGLLSQISQQSPPSLAEIYASAGVI